MDAGQLGKVLIDVGAPVLGGLIGGPGGALATTALQELAKALDVAPTPEAVSGKIAAAPEAVPAAARQAEDRMFSLWQAEQKALASATAVIGPWAFFKDGWRPALCWSLVFLWLWGLVIAPMISVYGRALAPLPIDTLSLFSTVVLTVLGGGHTAKAIFAKGAK